MNFYESVVIDYLRADRTIFVNAECCIQLNEADNPDSSGPHWYCDAIAADFRNRQIFLCEISYSAQLSSLAERLKGWSGNWDAVCRSIVRDSFLPGDWPVRPWLFIPEHLVARLVALLNRIAADQPPSFIPRITTLEAVQPWRYRSWNRKGEEVKPAIVPETMRL